MLIGSDLWTMIVMLCCVVLRCVMRDEVDGNSLLYLTDEPLVNS